MVLGQVWVVHADSSTAHDRALTYIENVLPLNIDKFGIELKIDGYATDIPAELNTHNIRFNNEDKILIYFLGSRVGTLDYLNVILAVRNNTIYQCAVDLHTGPDIGQSSLNDAVTIFLTRYHEYSGLDSKAMVDMVKTVDLTQDTIITSGNLTMTIQHTGDSSDTTEFCWIYPAGNSYATFNVYFFNNFPVSFSHETSISIDEIPSNPTPMPTPTLTISPTSTHSYSDWGLTGAIITVTITILAVAIAIIKRRRKAKPLML